MSDDSFVSGSLDKTLCIWRASTGDCLHVLRGHTHSVRSVCLLEDGRIASGGGDRTIRTWNVSTGKCVKVISSGHTSYIQGLIELSDGRLMSCSWDMTCKLFDIESGACLETIGAGVKIYCVSELSEKEVIVGGADGLVRLIDMSVRPARVMDVFKEGQKPTNSVWSICRMTRNLIVVSDEDGNLHTLTKS